MPPIPRRRTSRRSRQKSLAFQPAPGGITSGPERACLAGYPCAPRLHRRQDPVRRLGRTGKMLSRPESSAATRATSWLPLEQLAQSPRPLCYEARQRPDTRHVLPRCGRDHEVGVAERGQSKAANEAGLCFYWLFFFAIDAPLRFAKWES